MRRSDSITHSDANPGGVLMYSCDFCLCVSSHLHSDTNALYSEAGSHKAFNFADHSQRPVFVFLPGGCGSGSVCQVTLALTR